jgi:ketosteroid isomerase-like protein
MQNTASTLERNTQTAINYLKYIAAGSGSEGPPAFDRAFSLVSEDFEIEVMPASLKMPKMKLQPYRAWLEPMVKDQFVFFEAHVVNTTAQNNRVVIEATSSARTADGRDYGQQYFIAFEFNEAGKIRLVKEYTDSLYSSRFYTKADRPKI